MRSDGISPDSIANPTPGVLDTLSGGRATALLIGYLVLAPAAAAWLIARRDVS